MLLTEICLLRFKILNIFKPKIFIKAAFSNDKCVKIRQFDIFVVKSCEHFVEFEISNLAFQLSAAVEKNIKTQ